MWGAQLLKFSASLPPITCSYHPAKTSVSLNLSLSLPAGGFPLPRNQQSSRRQSRSCDLAQTVAQLQL